MFVRNLIATSDSFIQVYSSTHRDTHACKASTGHAYIRKLKKNKKEVNKKINAQIKRLSKGMTIGREKTKGNIVCTKETKTIQRKVKKGARTHAHKFRAYARLCYELLSSHSCKQV